MPPSAILTRSLFILKQVVTNALWYTTNHHQTINDAALSKASVLPIPPVFEGFEGYNDYKRKKMKCCQMQYSILTSHAEALYTLLQKPYSTPALLSMCDDIKQLGECFSAYAKHMKKSLEVTKANQSLDHPVRTVDRNATVENRKPTIFRVKPLYALLDAEARKMGMNNPFVFLEEQHLSEPFASNLQRFRYWHNALVSVPIDILKFSPGGSHVTIVCVQQAPLLRSDSEMLTQGARMVDKMRHALKECHTRAMKTAFKRKIQNIANIQPSVLEFIYAELAMDASAASNPEMNQRIRLMFMGHDGLIVDLRHLNPGRPGGYFDVFLKR